MSSQLIFFMIQRGVSLNIKPRFLSFLKRRSYIMEKENRKFKLASIQLQVGSDKQTNLLKASEKIKEAASNGAHIVSLPECFNSPYGGKYFPDYCEELPTGETYAMLEKSAKDNNVYLIGGSFPEKEDGKLYNTSLVFSPTGELLSKFRKIHLFDIDVPGKIVFKESDALSSGEDIITFDTPFCKVGVIICYDIRFPELTQLLALEHHCKLVVIPAAFNMTTGPAHWELLQRARALDNQIYIATVSPARDTEASYIAWGHSTTVNPWGTVIAKADEKDTILYSEIDLDYLDEVRDQIPVTKQRRNDIYKLEHLKNMK